ncbi:aspartate-semialdehyde dehydrogenase [Candidatus Protochlamydia phocaeensis]|uniref:aspartate-semialdehyde dehydrogenase n=1 Tax=Candidatus Protochlamydia phocaeensis TaxID=1414722 RepID=UPI000838EF79|nr:aspartate-semialdehyde dehydrogenase [Candidatus Protochlamydia phocaeensis]
MISSDFYFRDKIPVAILGATGCIGQKIVQLLERHPWFQIVALCASERSAGKAYGEAVHWLMPTPLPPAIAQMTVQACEPNISCSLVFSALDASVAGEIEWRFAEAGFLVVSNSRNHRLNPQVPLVIGEVNADHLELAKKQPFAKGKIITNPNCSVIGLTLALKPLFDRFGLEAVHAVTLQAVSGAGYPGVGSLDILDNVIPFISGEEEKIEKEPLKILGKLSEQGIQEIPLKISAQCNRVAVTNGHLACLSVKLKQKASRQELIHAWNDFSGEPQQLQLPSAPFQPLHFFEEPTYPQPLLHRSLDKEMAVSIGQLRSCPLLDYKFTLLSHNTVRGAAGAALLNAELLVKKGWVFW